MSILRDYYASGAMPALHTKASGAGTSVIDILEVIVSDFATGDTKEELQEEDVSLCMTKSPRETRQQKP